MSGIAATPEPPYYAVIFTSLRTEIHQGYDETAARMLELARGQDGFLGFESTRDGTGITISYWTDLDAIARWKAHAEHRAAQKRGIADWYSEYRVRIARVEREYGR